MIGEILMNLPVSGFTREILTHGLARVVRDFGYEVELDNEEFANFLEEEVKYFKKKISHSSSSKMGRNDKNSYAKTFEKWFGIGELPDTYLELILITIEETAKLLKKGLIDPMESFKTVKVGKKNLQLGVPFRGTYAILPAIIKQPEFYEFQTEFLRPTTGEKAQIELDPIWFSILTLGILTSFAGYYSGKYYFILKPGIEDYFADEYALENILLGIDALSSINIKVRASPSSEEIYELQLAFGLVESEVIVNEEIYPLILNIIELSGNVYTAIKTVEIDLRDLHNFVSEYVKKIGYLRKSGVRVTVKVKDEEMTPLKGMLSLAERELRSNIRGDNEMIAYIFIKDLYRAISSCNNNLLLDSIYRLLRKGRALLDGSSKGTDKFLLTVLRKFMSETHVGVFVE